MRVTEFEHRGEQLVVLSERVERPRAVSRLTRAEREVVEALLAGEERFQIAFRRGVALRTVLNQLASAYRKLGVRSGVELARALGGDLRDGSGT